MKIEHFRVKNFRCFEDEEWDFAPQVNLIVGENGTGKSAFLDALAFGLEALASQFTHLPLQFDPQSTRVVSSPNSLVMRWIDYAEAQIVAEIDSETYDWIRNRSGSQTTQLDHPNNLFLYATRFLSNDLKSLEANLQLIAYYRSQRNCSTQNGEQYSLQGAISRFSAYENCLNVSISQHSFLEWFRRIEFASLKRGHSFGTLDSVKEAIRTTIPGVKDITYEPLDDKLYVQFEDGHYLPLSHLSDGYRNMLTMVMDIAYRASVLNPHLEDFSKTEGIVLIDEIDLHLHPKWQREAIGGLVRTFPNLQFFLTTHSPFIIQSLEASENAKLINLSEPENTEYRRLSIEDIAEETQGVEGVSRSAKYHEMEDTAAEYYRLLEESKTTAPEEIDALKQKLDTLLEPFSHDPAYSAFLKFRRACAGVDA